MSANQQLRRSNVLKGILHIHSTYSDGEYRLPQLKEIFISAGCAFACVTDHAEAFDSDKLNSYVGECALLSDDRFCFIAGLEYECEDRIHVLGYGVTSFVGTRDPQEVIRQIKRRGGVSVIAHPRDEAFSSIERFQVLPDGIEAWNTKYDGRYAPRPATFAFLHRLQQRKRDMHAFYGLDLHWKNQFRSLFSIVQNQDSDSRNILRALGRGDFFARKGSLELLSTGEVSEQLLHHFAATQSRSARLRELLKAGKKLMGRFDAVIPPSLKSQLRRIY